MLSLAALGLCDKEIATRLGVSYRTVRTHIERLFEEHGFRSRTSAVAAWLLYTEVGADRADGLVSNGDWQRERSNGDRRPHQPANRRIEDAPQPYPRLASGS